MCLYQVPLTTLNTHCGMDMLVLANNNTTTLACRAMERQLYFCVAVLLA